MRTAALLLAAAIAASASTRVLVTVIDPKSGLAVTNLTAADFTAIDAGAPRPIEDVEFGSEPIDVLLLLDSSLLGQAVQATAADLIQQLHEKEQMALVTFDSSASLVQDFTSSKNTLLARLSDVKYGNDPHALDGLYASIDGGFGNAVFRKVVLLLTAGFEGSSRVKDQTVIRLARKKGIAVYPLYLSGRERGMFEKVARETGGAAMHMRNFEKAKEKPAARVFEIMRGRYVITLSGNLNVTEKFRVEVNRPGKLKVSTLPID
ncbi:MAG: VWA domain-containing protein [Bryobacteraceae bacterium]